MLANADATAEMKEEAIKSLDLRSFGGQWFTAKEVQAHEEAGRAIQAALAKWRPRLKKLLERIDSEDFARIDPAITEFHKIDDPAIVLVLESFLNEGAGRFEEEAVTRLASFKQYEATEVLVRFAVLANLSVTRVVACASLKQRPVHEYVPLLLAGLSAPIKGRYQIAWDRKGNISYMQAFLREGSSSDVLLVSHALALPKTSHTRIMTSNRPQPEESRWAVTAGTTPEEAFQQELAAARHRAANARAEFVVANSAIVSANQRIFETLERSTGEMCRLLAMKSSTESASMRVFKRSEAQSCHVRAQIHCEHGPLGLDPKDKAGQSPASVALSRQAAKGKPNRRRLAAPG